MSEARDHNLASMIQRILELPDDERVTSASVDGDGYRFETSRTYEGTRFGRKRNEVTFTNGLKVWHAIAFVHGTPEPSPEHEVKP